jgi:hypothetical protein
LDWVGISLSNDDLLRLKAYKDIVTLNPAGFLTLLDLR